MKKYERPGMGIEEFMEEDILMTSSNGNVSGEVHNPEEGEGSQTTPPRGGRS